MTDTLERLYFTTDFVALLGSLDLYIEYELSIAEAEELRKLPAIGAGGLPVNFEDAQRWAVVRNTKLHKEALEYQAAGHRYDLPMGYCDFDSNEKWVAYQSTSGTVHVVDSNGENAVYLPKERQLGHHHTMISLIKAGWSADDIDAWYINTWRLLHECDNKLQMVQKIADRLNPVLVPLGFPHRQTPEEYLAKHDNREAVTPWIEGAEFEREILEW
jgi:hypothetical protein